MVSEVPDLLSIINIILENFNSENLNRIFKSYNYALIQGANHMCILTRGDASRQWKVYQFFHDSDDLYSGNVHSHELSRKAFLNKGDKISFIGYMGII